MKKISHLLLNSYFAYIIIFILVFIAYHKTLSFWFYRGWEASWFFGLTGGNFTILNLMRSHGFVSYLNYLLFGWNPTGWYFTGIILHVLSASSVFYFFKTITKNNLLAFFSIILFLATTANHDVISWGSFESLYAAQTLGFYLALIFFYRFKKTKKTINFFFSLCFFFMSSLLRESGLIFIPILIFFDQVVFRFKNIFSFKPETSKKYIIELLFSSKIYIPYILIGLLYLFLRSYYGGSAHDYIDERVQYRILLFQEKRILEYLWLGILAFGSFIPPYFIPYPILNSLKTFIFSRYPYELINYYFFIVIGWGFYLLMIIALLHQRKSSLFKYLVFFLGIFTITTLFYSFSWSTKMSFFTIPYTWSENRWRYLAYTGFAGFIIFSIRYYLGKYLNPKRLTLTLIIFVVLHYFLQVYFLNKVHDQMYKEHSYHAMRFFTTIKQAMPNFNNDSLIVYNRASPGLNDFLAEFYYIYKVYFPGVKITGNEWIKSDMFYPLDKIGKYKNSKDYIFLDYSPEEGVLNKTEDVLSFLESKPKIFDDQKIKKISSREFNLEEKIELPVETRYKITLKYSAVKNNSISIDDSAIYLMRNTLDYVGDAKVNVCKTMGLLSEPFTDFKKEFLVDINLGYRSAWWADCRPAWVVLDLGRERKIFGFAHAALTSRQAAPLSYQYLISDNNKDWKEVKQVKNNYNQTKIDFLDSPVYARYVKFNVDQTQERHMLLLNEIIPIFYEELKEIKDLNSAYDLMYDYASYENKGFASVSWSTDPTNNPPKEETTYYTIISADGNINETVFILPESEYYSSKNQFLKRNMNYLNIVFPKNVSAEVYEIKISTVFSDE